MASRISAFIVVKICSLSSLFSFCKLVTTSTKGLATGSEVRVLGTNDWITTVTYYDDKARPVYMYSHNAYLNTTDKIKSKLDFVGKVEETSSEHVKGTNAAITTTDEFDYDYAGRLIQQDQTIGSHTETIVTNTYDELGQLQSKGVGNTATTPLQTVDYAYNIRGWLKQINNPTTLGNDLFSFKINYNAPTHGATALYNGNISETEWKTANDNTLRWYTYSYDALNRIASGTDNSNNYSLSSIAYDENGNITSLTRKGHTNVGATTFGTMDNLIYTYQTNSNKLIKVLDNGNDTYGFKDGVNSTTEYTYDDNGNMLKDLNKGMTSNILYNHLNLPTKVTFATGNIEYIYDASGVKLKKIVTETGNPTVITEYAGNYIYEDSSLQFFNQPEGYIEPDGSNGYNYIYQYKDHLGNIRLSYTDANGDGDIDVTTDPNTNEIVEENNYYPFGLEHKGYNNVVNGTENKFMTYNGKELDESLGLNWLDLGARNYDATLGRFMNIDPLAEQYYKQSTYTFAANNPVLLVDINGEGTDDVFYINKDGSIERVEQEGSHQFYVQTTGGNGTKGVVQEHYTLVGTLAENDAGLVEFPASGETFGRYGTDDAGGEDSATGETVGEGDHFVTPETAAALFGVVNDLGKNIDNIDLGDMSSDNGSDPWQSGFQHHSGHGHNGNRSGLDVDFRYMNSDGESFQSSNAFNSSSFSSSNNTTVYNKATKYGFTQNYQGTSGSLSGVTTARGHNDHGHIGRANNTVKVTTIAKKKISHSSN